MTRHRNSSLAALCVLTLVCAASVREFLVRPDGLTHVFILDVGQGDSIFIVGPSGQQILIDAGPNLSALSAIARRMSFFDRTIDVAILTHPHLDHLYAFPELLSRMNVRATVLTGVAVGLPQYKDMLAALKEKQMPVLIADPMQDIDLGDGLVLDILWPPPVYAGNVTDRGINDTSVVAMLRYGEDSILLTGDMEEGEEHELLASGADLRATILKAGHHGSKTSTSTGLLLAVDPDIAVISAGSGNTFGHPHASTLKRLEYFGVEIRRTDLEGTIELILDGKNGI